MRLFAVKSRVPVGVLSMAALFAVAACQSESPAAPVNPPAGVPNMANPASQYCVSQGGTIMMSDGPNGQSGYCSLPDGRMVEEWELFRAQL